MAAEPQVTSAPSHLPGLTRVCFSPDGAAIFTGGTDSLVRIHRADDPEAEPGFYDDHDEAVTSLSCSGAHLATGSTDNIARLYSYPANQFEGFVTRSSGVAIRWVQIDKQGERVAVCSDDLLVKIVHVADPTRVSLLSDNPKPVRSAAWDPRGSYLVAAGCDGKLRIYDTTGGAPACVKVMEGVIGASESDTSCYAAWHPSGSYFAVPLRTNDIGIVNKDGWAKQATFSQDGHTQVVGELSWSANGNYLASAAGTEIIVWARESKQVVSRYTAADQVTGLAWSPTSNLICFTSLDGHFSRWDRPVPADLPSPVLSDAAQARRVERLLDDGDVDMDDDLFGDGAVGEDDGFGDGDLDGGEWIVDDEGEGEGYKDEEKWGKGRTEVVNVTKAQDAFTPGSTVWRNKKRYLAFNMIGVVDTTDQETHHVVNVEFHDKAARRGYHFADHHRFSMASLGEQGVAYAAPAEGAVPSTVHYRPYDTWASAADWSAPLLPGEAATCVAAAGARDGLAHVAVATSSGTVRFFTGSGVQRYLWRLGDDVVSMAGGRDSVLVVHREGGTSLDGCQNLRYSLIGLDDFDILQQGRIPLLRKATLSWVGYTSDDAPAIYDSTGVLSVLDRANRPGQGRWVPLFDAATVRKEGRQEAYWPVGVRDGVLSCVVLKGAEKEPWFPRPLIQNVDIRMPLLNIDNQQGKLEESIARGSVHLALAAASDAAHASALQVQIDKDLLQLVQTACKSDALARALDVARLMHNPATVEAAAKVAAFYHLPGLQERIQAVRPDVERRRRRRAAGPTGPPPPHEGRRARDSTPGGGALAADFAPRTAARRSFGGKQRAETPLSSAPQTVVPETPGDERGPSGAPDSPERRKRALADDDDYDDEEAGAAASLDDASMFAPPPPRPSIASSAASAAPARNPFAKRAAGTAGNPFARPAGAGAGGATALDAVKSTSFFDRVDDIEASGVERRPSKKPAKAAAPAGKKQTTLFGLAGADRKRPAPPAPRDSAASTSTEVSGSELDGAAPPGAGFDESLVPMPPTRASPESMDARLPEVEGADAEGAAGGAGADEETMRSARYSPEWEDGDDDDA